MFSPDGRSMIPRAHVLVVEECPAEIRDKVNFAIAKGWVHPVVNMRNEEYTWELLKNEPTN